MYNKSCILLKVHKTHYIYIISSYWMSTIFVNNKKNKKKQKITACKIK